MPIPELIPGDCLLYFQDSFFDWLIAIKTWNKVAHVEVYDGENFSMASRNGIGVNRYPFRSKGLAYVRRPVSNPNMTGAREWFQTVRGQKYDWLGLLCFTLAVHQGSAGRMFCSEFATRLYRKGGIEPVAPDYDADLVAPAQFLQSDAFVTIYREFPIAPAT